MTNVIPAGYLAKRVRKPDGFHMEQISDVYSVSACVNDDFADYINYWRHNGYWLFDSPEIIGDVAKENSIDLAGTSLFYYEVYEHEFDGSDWRVFHPEESFQTHVVQPASKRLEGFDVVTFFCGNAPECSPLSCNSLAKKIPTNPHCLLSSFQEAVAAIGHGKFNNGEPGPYRIFAVYSVEWGKTP